MSDFVISSFRCGKFRHTMLFGLGNQAFSKSSVWKNNTFYWRLPNYFFMIENFIIPLLTDTAYIFTGEETIYKVGFENWVN